MYTKTIKIPNGDFLVDYVIYQCISCGEEVGEECPRVVDDANVYCWDCGFKRGLIDQKEWLKNSGIALMGYNATIIDGKIVIYRGKHPDEFDDRKNYKYRKWRNEVLKRDGLKCRKCGDDSKQLHAHHIKPFAKFIDLRYEVSNGLTLCKKCHIEEHRKR